MAGTIVVAVRKALIAALTPVINGTAGMESVDVRFQYPAGDDQPREVVWTQNPQIDLQSASLRAGRNFLNETSTFDVVLMSWQPATTAEDAATRVIEIGEVIAAWIGDHKNGETLNVPGLQTLTVSGSASQTETLENDSVTGRMQIPIRYTARLT